MSKQDVNNIAGAYLSLLKVSPNHEFRINNQAIYAEMRDYIAAAKRRTPQEIQDAFEEMVTI